MLLSYRYHKISAYSDRPIGIYGYRGSKENRHSAKKFAGYFLVPGPGSHARRPVPSREKEDVDADAYKRGGPAALRNKRGRYGEYRICEEQELYLSRWRGENLIFDTYH